jgi:hypothetical protein
LLTLSDNIDTTSFPTTAGTAALRYVLALIMCTACYPIREERKMEKRKERGEGTEAREAREARFPCVLLPTLSNQAFRDWIPPTNAPVLQKLLSAGMPSFAALQRVARLKKPSRPL